jgi:hypothetical protein
MRADFSSQNYFRNPPAEIEKLRLIGPVVEVRFPIVGKVWTTTTQELADRILKDSDASFSAYHLPSGRSSRLGRAVSRASRVPSAS